MRKSLSVMLLSLLSLPVFAQPSGLQADLDAMVAAERAFSKLSVEKGFKESFLTYIAEDGILFRPTPVKGKEMLASRPNPPIQLVWWPSHAEIARSGEMGWTTGPWERRSEGSDEVGGQLGPSAGPGAAGELIPEGEGRHRGQMALY